jgi:hypothetical protein
VSLTSLRYHCMQCGTSGSLLALWMPTSTSTTRCRPSPTPHTGHPQPRVTCKHVARPRLVTRATAAQPAPCEPLLPRGSPRWPLSRRRGWQQSTAAVQALVGLGLLVRGAALPDLDSAPLPDLIPRTPCCRRWAERATRDPLHQNEALMLLSHQVWILRLLPPRSAWPSYTPPTHTATN